MVQHLLTLMDIDLEVRGVVVAYRLPYVEHTDKRYFRLYSKPEYQNSCQFVFVPLNF